MANITTANITVNKLPPGRRNNTINKLKLDIDDVLYLFDSIDQSGELEKLPRYATDNLDHIPVFKMDAGGFSVLLAKLDKLDEKIDKNYGMSSSAPVTYNHQLPSVSDAPDMEWGDTGDSVSADPFDGPSRRKKKRKIIVHGNVLPSGIATEPINPRANVNDQGSTIQKYSQAVKNTIASKHKRIIGKCNNVDPNNVLRSAKPYVKKKIFAVHNVDPTETVESLSRFVTNICGAAPISCFLVANRTTDADHTDKPLTFRVCIDDQYCAKFRDQYLWHNGIDIRDWKFKPKQTNRDNADTAVTLPSVK